MKNKLSRKKFLATFSGTGVLALLNNKLIAATENHLKNNSLPQHKYFPAQDPDLVQEMVGASHGQIDKVKELLAAHPELAKACWDWGFGDWETALGAASHVGNKPIAELLMAHGARPDIFTFTMLGNLDVVKAMVTAIPGIQKIKGPHNITLLAHAKIRLGSKTISEEEKAKAQAMVDYLTSLGDADIKSISLPMTDDEKKQYIGTYSYGDQPQDAFVVNINKAGSLTIKTMPQKFERTLLKVKKNSFAPVGADNVEILFEIKEGNAIRLTINDPATIVVANKV